MLKKIIKITTSLICVVMLNITAFADISTGLIGQYNFDGNLKNEVTGNEAGITANKVNVELTGSEKALYANGVTKSAIMFNGFTSAYGLELVDAAPDTNTFTISYDVYYLNHTQYSSTVFLANSWEYNEELWASFGWGWQPSLKYAAGVWIHDMINKNPREWIDVWNMDGTSKLVDSDGFSWCGYWNNITYSVDNGVVKVYVTGEDIGVTVYSSDMYTPSINFVNNNTKLYLGVNAWDSPVNAVIDNLYIYNRALSEADINELIVERDYDAAIDPTLENETEIVPEKKPTLANKDDDYLIDVDPTTSIMDEEPDYLIERETTTVTSIKDIDKSFAEKFEDKYEDEEDDDRVAPETEEIEYEVYEDGSITKALAPAIIITLLPFILIGMLLFGIIVTVIIVVISNKKQKQNNLNNYNDYNNY